MIKLPSLAHCARPCLPVPPSVHPLVAISPTCSSGSGNARGSSSNKKKEQEFFLYAEGGEKSGQTEEGEEAHYIVGLVRDLANKIKLVQRQAKSEYLPVYLVLCVPI